MTADVHSTGLLGTAGDERVATAAQATQSPLPLDAPPLPAHMPLLPARMINE